MTVDSISFWTDYIARFSYRIYKILYGKKYGDSQITRPYIRFEKNRENYENVKKVFSLLKDLWGGEEGFDCRGKEE